MTWKIHSKDFPKQKTFKEQMRFLIQYAVLAPNSHNTQPWKFEINSENRSINIYLDWQRSLAYSDRFNRESYISLGCALGNLTVALEYFNFRYQIKYFPEETVKNVAIKVLVIEKTQLQEDSTLLSKLFQYLTKRVTNRFPPQKKSIKKNILQELGQFSNEKNVKAIFVTEEREKIKISDIMYHAIHYAFSDEMFKDELSKWIRSNFTKQKDGIPLYDSGIPAPITILAPWLIKTVPAKLQATTDKILVRNSSCLLILSSTIDDRLSWIKAGKIFEYIALAGAAHSIFFSPMAAIIEHAGSKKNLTKFLNIQGYPLFFARLSYIDKTPPHSPRRTISDVLL